LEGYKDNTQYPDKHGNTICGGDDRKGWTPFTLCKGPHAECQEYPIAHLKEVDLLEGIDEIFWYFMDIQQLNDRERIKSLKIKRRGIGPEDKPGGADQRNDQRYTICNDDNSNALAKAQAFFGQQQSCEKDGSKDGASQKQK
jgi:hypothetical protein